MSGDSVSEKMARDQIAEMVGAITDPIIVMEPGWEVPDWARKEMPLARLVQNMLALKDPAEAGLASELEALVYLNNASLVAPMHPHWVNIYMYLFTRIMRARKTEVPEELAREEISDYEQKELRGLRRWIWETRVKARQARWARERAEAGGDGPAEVEARVPKQLSMF